MNIKLDSLPNCRQFRKYDIKENYKLVTKIFWNK